MQMPQRFDLTYVGSDNEKHRPVMIHRVIFGSIERFIGILIEHFAGRFPAWLAPMQVKVLPITDRNNDYTDELIAKMQAFGIRCSADKRQEKTGFKIREAQLSKVPYMLVLGDKEQEEGTVAVRRSGSQATETMKADDFIAMLVDEINNKK